MMKLFRIVAIQSIRNVQLKFNVSIQNPFSDRTNGRTLIKSLSFDHKF